MKKLLALTFFFAAAASAQQYKWVDQDGKVRYGDVPPPGANATRLKPPTAGTPGAPAEAKKDGGKPLTPEQAFRKRQDDAQKEQQNQAKADQEAQARRENCARAQEALRSFESGQRIARTDAKGERYFLEDAQVAQETAKARQAVQQSCS
ncbi:MAG TPA: DUF4124 domain-containing protein [Burkholderiales bacterium]|nr:DUF4124 domain-containing protein [Burkholderiales bacterium]